MSINRRDFLKLSACSAGALTFAPNRAFGSGAGGYEKYGKHFSMLNDGTRCTGCRACQTACKENKNLEADAPNYPKALDAKNLTLIKMYKGEGEMSFLKRQCMHCNKPGCVSACPASALQKKDNGLVKYYPDKCIGCRYCMVACPFNVPAFEYDKAFPVIQKCDFCEEQTTKGEPTVCSKVCPTGAIAFGTRKAMLAEAKRRLKESPERYVPHIYGEKELGGTAVLYLSSVPFEKLGLRTFDAESPTDLSESIQHGIFKYFIPPVALFGALGLISYLTRPKVEKADKEEV